MLKRGVLKTRDYRIFTIINTDDNGESSKNVAFEGASNAAQAFHNDTVEWIEGEDGCNSAKVIRVISRAESSRFHVGTLELNSKTRYGMTSRGALLFRFTPFDPAYPPFFVGCSKKDTSQNILVRIEFDKWTDNSTCPRGNLIQTFGVAGDMKAEENALLYHYSPVKWGQGKASPTDTIVVPKMDVELYPFLDLPTFHIDPPGCKDIDDAITIEEVGINEYAVHIHIADVAAWLRKNRWLQEKAAAIGQTLYCDGKAVNPMFPLELSENAFSLLPGQLRRVLTCSFKWKRGLGQDADVTWSSRTIRVTHSYTYESAQDAPWAAVLSEICGTSDSHKWVEHLMLFYNKEAAKLLRQYGKGLLRRHAAPKEELLTVCKELGLPAEKMAMAAGEYCLAQEDDVHHWGIGTALYCHASSPIRRWADCLNQMCLTEILRKYIEGGAVAVDKTTVSSIQELSKKAKSYERELVFLRLILAPNPTSSLKGVVVKEGRVWVHHWDRTIKVDTRSLVAGSEVRVFYFYNPSERNWKNRIIFRVDSLGN
jgi:exoribonuclease R